VLIAPQEFKGSLSPSEAAAAIASGIRAARPGWELDVQPMSDGGPGFLEAMRAAGPADMAAVAVDDPLGRRVLARYVVLRDPRTVIIEAAQANGLMHVAEQERDALRASTSGVGQLLAEAVTCRPARMIIGVGGSATTDAGHGMARSLGARFLDRDGGELAPGGASLARLHAIAWTRPAAFDGIDVVVATDVTNPLTGQDGAAAVYGPQKGASPDDVAVLDAALRRFAEVCRRTGLGEVEGLPGAGAAGGLAAGLSVFLGARITSGFDTVADVTRLFTRLQRADVVVTGEGSFDAQSLKGKTTGRLAAIAAGTATRCLVISGREPSVAPPGVEVRSLQRLAPDLATCLSDASSLLTRVAHDWAAAAA
jgi:glycerate kinase